jgi:microsomal triglyceride transfer protein large subunit
VFQFGIYAEGLESLVGESGDQKDEGSPTDEESEDKPTAGLTFTLMDVLLRQIEFFRGSGGLMSAVWNAPSELTSALQVWQNVYCASLCSHGLQNISLTTLLAQK